MLNLQYSLPLRFNFWGYCLIIKMCISLVLGNHRCNYIHLSCTDYKDLIFYTVNPLYSSIYFPLLLLFWVAAELVPT